MNQAGIAVFNKKLEVVYPPAKIAPIDNDNNGSVIFDPSKFPTDIPLDFFKIAIKEIDNSGIDVPIPENNPIIPSGIPAF